MEIPDLFLNIHSAVEFYSLSTGVVIAAVLAAILLFLSGYASGSEIAFFNLSPNDLNELDPIVRNRKKTATGIHGQ